MNELISYFGPKHIPEDIRDRYNVAYLQPGDTDSLEKFEGRSVSVLETPSVALPDALLLRIAGLLLYPGRHPQNHHDLEVLSNEGIRTAYFENDTPWNRAVVNYLLKAVGSFLARDLHTFANIETRKDIKLRENNSDLSIGMIGTGSIGGRFARNSRGLFPNANISYSNERGVKPGLAELNIFPKSWFRIFEDSDVVVASLPHFPETEHRIGEEELGRMGKDSLFVSVSGGGVVNEGDLVGVLQENPGLTAIIDTALDETNNWINTPYIKYLKRGFSNLILTYHSAYKDSESTKRLVYAITRPLLHPNMSILPTNLSVRVPGECYNDDGYNLRID